MSFIFSLSYIFSPYYFIQHPPSSAPHVKPQAASAIDPKEGPPAFRALVRRAKTLADMAKRGELVLFLGAGVSAGAGLPTWNALLLQLAAKVGVQTPEQIAYFNALDFLSKAQVVQQRMPAGKQVRGVTSC